MNNLSRNVSYFLIFILFFAQCTQKNEEKKEKDKFLIVATTGMLYDAVINIAGDKVDALPIMGSGVDPHLYKATGEDLQKFRNADMIIFNGLGLEGKIEEILKKMGKQKPCIPVAESIPKELLISTTNYENSYDPHVWFDASIWQYCVKAISKNLCELDKKNKDIYLKNTALYLDGMEKLHNYALARINEIPENKKILVTAHDAFGYFGKAYNIEVIGLQGISTVADVSLRKVTEIVDLIIQNDLKAIFAETSVSEKTLNAIISGCADKNHKVEIYGSLYSDAMGEFGTETGTYLGMFTYNVETIVTGLSQ